MNRHIRFLAPVRLFALGLILLYHFFPELLPGGFVGVDIFFVLSGFLLASRCVEEVEESGRFAFGAFCVRRVKRIYPTLVFSLLLTLPLLLLVSPDFLVGLPRQLGAALSFSTNIFELQTGGAYEAGLLPHPYVHTWFLSVELQLCLVFGLLVFLLTGAKRFRKTLCFGALALALLSFAAMQLQYVPEADPTPVYFSPLSHGFPFCLGVALGALLPHLKPILKSKRFLLLGVCASLSVITLLALLLRFSEAGPYRYGLPLTSLLSCVLLACCWGLHNIVPQERAEPKWLGALSAFSYPIYLIHWPVFIVCDALLGMRPVLTAVATLAGAGTLTCLIYYVFSKKGYLRWVRAGICTICLAFTGFVFVRVPLMATVTEDLQTAVIEEDVLLLYEAYNTLASYKGPTGGRDIFVGEEPAEEAPPAEPDPETPPAVKPRELGLTIIGDSVTLGARGALREAFPDMNLDAEVGRGPSGGLSVIRRMTQKGTLKEYVVIALGANLGSRSEAMIEDILLALPGGHRLIFVTPFDGRSNRAKAVQKLADYLRALPDSHSHVTIADWAQIAQQNLNQLSSDTMHMKTPEIRSLFVGCIEEAVLQAAEGPCKS